MFEAVSGSQMLEAFGQAIVTFLQPKILIVLFPAILLGIIIGILPGIGGLVGGSLLLPLLFRLPPEMALTILVAFYAVTFTGGSITAVLINIPGTGPNAVTLIDGFPMTQKGEGGRAVGAAVTASMMGGVGSVFLALLTVPLVMPIIMAFKAPELFVLVFLGLVFMAEIISDSPIKGMISGFMGLLISLVGVQGLTGTDRLTFGSSFLLNGLDLVAVATGLFGISELIDMLVKGQSRITQKIETQKMSQVLQGARDVFVHRLLWLRSTVIGYVVGVIPAIGAETAIWVAYAQAKKTSKNPEKFGKGCVEGVIAPESANNAEAPGALLTTMAFGIPGSAFMAILLGGFLLVGVVPGPAMMREHLPLAFILIIGMAVSNIIGGLFCLAAAPYLAKVALVNMDFLFPVVLILIFAGAYISANSMLNVIVAIIFGLLGFIMKRLGYFRPPLLLGFVLGELMEFYLLRSVKLFGPLFFMTPICLVQIAIIIGLFGYPYVKKALQRGR